MNTVNQWQSLDTSRVGDESWHHGRQSYTQHHPEQKQLLSKSWSAMDMQDDLEAEEGRKTTREMLAMCALRYQDSDSTEN